MEAIRHDLSQMLLMDHLDRKYTVCSGRSSIRPGDSRASGLPVVRAY